jgi:hypothetical protein
VLVGLGIALPGGDRDDAGARRRIESYQAELLPLVKEWGRIEVQGMRPAIADLMSGQGVPPETVAGEARAWRAGFEGLRQKISALDPPEALEDAERLFDRSMQRYLDATIEFEQAAEGAGPARSAGIDRGIAAARDGARLYNEASLVLQRVRQKVGLPPTDEFPEHPAGREDVSEDVKDR